MMALALSTTVENPQQIVICLRIRLKPAVAVGTHTIRRGTAAPHALLRSIALALVGALAGLVALPLGQHALDAALKLAELRRLLLRLAAVDHIDAQRRHLGFKLPPLQVVAMAAIN